ncbi:hypothetical protein H5410_004866, partial [Solanum commersonii]
AIKEKHITILEQAIMKGILSCISKQHKERYYCSIQATNNMVWPHQVMLPCKALYCAIFKLIIGRSWKSNSLLVYSITSLMNGYYLPIQGYQEKHLTIIDQAIMEGILSCKSKLQKEGYYCSIQATNDMVWPHQVMLPCKDLYWAKFKLTIGWVLLLIRRLSKKTSNSSYQAWSCLTNASYS